MAHANKSKNFNSRTFHLNGIFDWYFLAGIIAIKLSTSEKRNKEQEKLEEVKKTLLFFYQFSFKLEKQWGSILNYNEQISQVENPFDNIVTQLDKDGNEIYHNFPSHEEIELNKSEIKAIVDNNKNKAKNILNVLREISLIEIHSLSYEKFKRCTEFKGICKYWIESLIINYIDEDCSSFPEDSLRQIMWKIKEFNGHLRSVYKVPSSHFEHID